MMKKSSTLLCKVGMSNGAHFEGDYLTENLQFFQS
jgi:hypothetical protein